MASPSQPEGINGPSPHPFPFLEVTNHTNVDAIINWVDLEWENTYYERSNYHINYNHGMDQSPCLEGGYGQELSISTSTSARTVKSDTPLSSDPWVLRMTKYPVRTMMFLNVGTSSTSTTLDGRSTSSTGVVRTSLSSVR